jgi:hypothetical protein
VNPYAAAQEFAQLFGQVEFALKRSEHLSVGKKHAEADWYSFAKDLGPDFFDRVAAAGIAKTIINDPPRKLMRDLAWDRKSGPLTNTQELIVIGVCRVRNSYIHGEKFVGGGDDQWERDATLVREALAVLKFALSQAPD